MTESAWLEENNAHLEAELHLLRLRLRRLAGDESAPAPAPPMAPPETVSALHSPVPASRRRWARSGDLQTPGPPMLSAPAGSSPSIEEEIRQAEARRDAAAAGMDPDPALTILAERLGLSAFERDVLLLCTAIELDPAMPALCARANPPHNYPTFALALSAFDSPSWDALAAHRPLRYARLVEITQPGGTPLTSSLLRADERIVNFLKGLNVLDDRIAGLLEPVDGDREPALAPSQQAVLDAVLQRMQHDASTGVLPVVQLVGTDAGSRMAVARRAAATLHRSLYRVGVEALPSQVADIEHLARLWQRESLLLPVALYVDAENLEGVSAEATAAFERFLTRQIGLTFVAVRGGPIPLNCRNVAVDVSKPTAEEQRAAWATALGAEEDDLAVAETSAILAGQFDLNLDEINETAAITPAVDDKEQPRLERLWATCRHLIRPRLDHLAERLEPKATWDDLVLPAEALHLLRQIAGHVRHRHRVYEDWGFSQRMTRGYGISALFAGESGTGKTMAAEVIANELALSLYRIDLSAVVSKYIGETEKNLRKLFDAAEAGGAILLFDEADALYGKRSEVKDSHDRYANIEINYLLQRMEAFTGLAILATNLKSALDQAFMRRLRFIVNFQFPGVPERRQIWQKALPDLTPTEELDFDRLARLNLTGGAIHNIALNAAFLAAQDGQTVTMPLLLAAARMELRKLDKPINEAELR